MRWFVGSTVLGFALLIAPQPGPAQAPEKIQQGPKPSAPAPGYRPDYRYPPTPAPYTYGGMASSYGSSTNPYGSYPPGYGTFGMYPPYAPPGWASYLPPTGPPPYAGSMFGSGGYGPYGMSGLGSGGYNPSGTSRWPPPAPTADAKVTIHDNYFEPRTVYVTPGGRVRWVNKGKRVHNVSGFAGGWGSKTIQPGQSYTFTLRRALNYYYYDSRYPLEMSGSIIVRPPPPDQGPPPGQGGGYQGQGPGGYANPK